MPAKKKQQKKIPNSAELADSFLLDLAERLDPPIVTEEAGWELPPDIVDWAHSNFLDPTTNKLVRLQEHQQRMFRTIFNMIWDHQIDTVVWAEIKKSGKTTAAGLAGAYWGTYIESPNEVITIANDQEQAQGRIYAAMVPTLKKLGWDVPDQKPVMTNHDTGSKIRAIGTSYEGEAGGNYGLTLWSELWAYKSERRKRLWDEMTHVPTRRYSVRWVETYAGFLNESDLLWEIYCSAFREGKEDQPIGEKIKGLEDLPIWYLPQSKTFIYWSHDPRMPWQTQVFMDSQRSAPGMRPSTFRRLWQNYWVSSEEVFIEPAQWDALHECEPLNEEGDTRQLFIAVDASESNDSSAVDVACWSVDPNKKDDPGCPEIVACWEYKPQFDEAIEKPVVDLSATVVPKLTWLLDNFDVGAVYYDHYQLHSIMTDLRKKYDPTGTRKTFVDFPQGAGRILSDQSFYRWIVDAKLKRIKSAALREHVLNAIAKSSERGYRLDKSATTKKIDLAVAAAMATYAASVGYRPKRKFIKV